MMTQSNLIRNLLRVLTPEEASDLTTLGDASAKDALTDLLLAQNRGDKISYSQHGLAKVIPFPERFEASQVSELGPDVVITTGPRVDQFINQFVTKVKFESGKVHPGAKPVETSTFIINEKEKFKTVYTRLKSREVLDLYAKNSVVDLEQERKNRRDLSKNSSTGVLVNKKHY
ncbi:hypothetical protein M902_1591 [Bacteriovorax sp. BAL6_X]|uniref:hypothetical protein n=1 Tax=Bacteriovorax sp. BAL6_X TaxID=1201290 RepID=UPI0003865059|nr:hypothetical protein [Bacteriovorax sp. BAL6_X]EPZ50336.1 hypothetical protein M902_1591 [Bacteriovorax sp. BAL6_X]